MGEYDSLTNAASMAEFETLARNFGASEGIPVARVKSLKGVVAALPWLAYFDEDDQQEFWRELYIALDEIHCQDRSEATAAAYAKAAGVVLSAWRTTARAIDDGVMEVLENTEDGDFGEVPPPYQPRYIKGSIIERVDVGVGRRYRVLDVKDGFYRLEPLGIWQDPPVVVWAWETCDRHTKLEWIDNNYKVGIIEGAVLHARTLSSVERKKLGLTADDL
jgi:hypothetical protein